MELANEHDIAEINGKTYQLVTEEKDIKISYARLLGNRRPFSASGA